MGISEVSFLEMSMMGTVLISAIVLLRKCVGQKLTPGCYLALWTLAGVRLLFPLSIALPFSIYQLMPEQSSITAGDANAVPVWLNVDLQALALSNGVADSPAEPFYWITVIWLIGALLCFLYMMSSHWLCRRWYAASLPMESAFVQQWKQKHPLYRRYQIQQSQLVHTPLTYGLFHPVILLPASQWLHDDELHLVLLHEWNHIRHLDILWQWLLAVLCSVHWFNPAVWVMYFLCRQDLELFCDAATVKQLNEGQNRSYAMLLLNQAAQVKRQTPAFSSSRFTGYQRMEERIRMIMEPKKLSWKLAAATIALLCVGGAAFATTSGTVNDNDAGLEETLVWPVASEDADITLLYGVRKHPITGEEINIDHISVGSKDAEGSAVMAAASGIVKEAGYDVQKGYYLLIQHDNGLETCSWHCEQLLVEEGDTVSAYQQIATLGKTGDAAGPCLSFAVYQNGESVDPMKYFNAAESGMEKEE